MLSLMRAPRESHYLLRFEINLVVVILDGLLCCVGSGLMFLGTTHVVFNPEKGSQKRSHTAEKNKNKMKPFT